MIKTALGIDIGGTNTEVGLVDKNGKCLQIQRFSTAADRPFVEFMAQLEKAIALITHNGEIKPFAAGVGAPGANSETGRLEDPENFSWGSVELAGIMQKKFGIPVKVINDAKAAALGEMKYGQALNLKNFVQITLGTGLGSSIIIDGKLVEGHDGLAGELGHIKVRESTRQCSCGKIGCLETYASANGLCRTVFELLSRNKTDSKLREYSYEQINSQMVFELAQNGDELAIEAFKYTGTVLGETLAGVISLLNPQAILFAGGLTSAGNYLFEPLIQSIEKNLLNMHKDTVDILISDQRINYAVSGAASLVFNTNGKHK